MSSVNRNKDQSSFLSYPNHTGENNHIFCSYQSPKPISQANNIAKHIHSERSHCCLVDDLCNSFVLAQSSAFVLMSVGCDVSEHNEVEFVPVMVEKHAGADCVIAVLAVLAVLESKCLSCLAPHICAMCLCVHQVVNTNYTQRIMCALCTEAQCVIPTSTAFSTCTQCVIPKPQPHPVTYTRPRNMKHGGDDAQKHHDKKNVVHTIACTACVAYTFHSKSNGHILNMDNSIRLSGAPDGYRNEGVNHRVKANDPMLICTEELTPGRQGQGRSAYTCQPEPINKNTMMKKIISGDKATDQGRSTYTSIEELTPGTRTHATCSEELTPGDSVQTSTGMDRPRTFCLHMSIPFNIWGQKAFRDASATDHMQGLLASGTIDAIDEPDERSDASVSCVLGGCVRNKKSCAMAPRHLSACVPDTTPHWHVFSTQCVPCTLGQHNADATLQFAPTPKPQSLHRAMQ